MGTILWFVKMCAKVMKPFVKIAIIEALLEALMGYFGGDEEAEDATPTDGE